MPKTDLLVSGQLAQSSSEKLRSCVYEELGKNKPIVGECFK